MKKKLKKLSESTVAKVILATIIPGGFIAWGAYELGKRVKLKQSDISNKPNDDDDKPEDS